MDRRVGLARERGQVLDARQLLHRLHLGPRLAQRVEVGRPRALLELDRGVRRASVGDARRRARRRQHRLEGQVLGERVAGLVADHHPQADALVDRRAGAADDAVLHRDRVVAAVLEVEVGSVGAARGQFGHDARDRGLVDGEPPEVVGEGGLFTGDHGGAPGLCGPSAAAEQAREPEAEGGDGRERAAR
nr:hypothetical protein [Nannocystis pusilla]